MISGLEIPFVQIALLLFILITSISTALLKDVLASIILFTSYSLGMAIYYVLLLAPDVGMTEAAVSAGITTILLLLTIAKTVHPGHQEVLEDIEWKALIPLTFMVLILALNLTHFPALGDPEASAWNNPVTQYYIENSYEDLGVQNTVTAVLAGYRGFDTLGEAVVVFAAGIASLIVLHREVFTDAQG